MRRVFKVGREEYTFRHILVIVDDADPGYMTLQASSTRNRGGSRYSITAADIARNIKDGWWEDITHTQVPEGL